MKVKDYSAGDSFGELALLYNAPRAASIQCKTNTILWELDRETFNSIVKDAAMKKRERYEDFLSKMNILQSLEKYELTLIADALSSFKVSADSIIIKQHEEGDKFFIIEEGKTEARIVFDGG